MNYKHDCASMFVEASRVNILGIAPSLQAFENIVEDRFLVLKNGQKAKYGKNWQNGTQYDKIG